jgi:hypothetical protein
MKKFDSCFVAGPFRCKVWPNPNGTHVVRIELVNGDGHNAQDYYLTNQASLRDAMVEVVMTLCPTGVHYVKSHFQQIEGGK